MIVTAFPRIAALCFLFTLGACLNYADYSLQAYTYATEVKAKTAILLGKTSEPYATHKDEAEALLLDIEIAYEFARGTDNNEEATQLWESIRDEDGFSVAGVIKRWRVTYPNGVPQNNALFEQALNNLIDELNRLICLEANKREPTTCPAPVANPV